jgi:hypothetical protein
MSNLTDACRQGYAHPRNEGAEAPPASFHARTADDVMSEVFEDQASALAGKLIAMAAWAAGTSDVITQAAFDIHPEWRHA